MKTAFGFLQRTQKLAATIQYGYFSTHFTKQRTIISKEAIILDAFWWNQKNVTYGFC